MHGSGQAICSAVTDFDGILLGLELGDRADGAEDLLLHDLHILADVGEDRGLDEVTFLSVTSTTDFDFGAGLLTLINVSKGGNQYRLATLCGQRLLTP